MGGSQLKQLKASLHASGLSRTSAPKDARKRKNQSSTSLAHRNDKFATIGQEFNKFDIREEKQKFEVVTRKGKVEETKKGKPGQSRAAGTELRKKTLLPFLDARTHTSTFLDHRFGEGSANLTPEEKALERFTAERTQRLSNKDKKARFNLGDDADDDDEDAGLTHGGVKLGFGDEEELEAGGWGGLGDAVANGAEGANREPLLRRRMAAVKAEEEEEEEQQPERKKTKAEVMEEIMVKSKMHKHERKKIRSADDETRLELDAGLKELQFMLAGGGVIPRPQVDADGAPVVVEAAASAAAVDDDEEEDDEEDDMDDDDEDDEELGSDEEDSDGASHYSLNDEELEAAIAASGKSGVDRDLLRKLIGGGDSDSDDEPTPAPKYIPPQLQQATPAFIPDPDAPRPPPRAEAKADADPYDLYVRQLALEPRAHATDRMKTPLELAKDAAEELQQFEEKRLRRQRGEKDDSEDEEADKRNKKKARKPEGDDLEADYLEEEMGSEVDVDEGGLGAGLEAEEEQLAFDDDEELEGESASEEEGEEEEESGSDDEMDVGDLDAATSDDEVDPDAVEDLVAPTTAEPVKKRAWGGEEVKAELPFTFPCLSTHAEFVTLLASSGIKEADTATVVKRIRVLYHPGLSEGNKQKLQIFTHVLLDHVLALSSRPTESTYTTINSLLPHLLTLSHAFPLTTAPYYVAKLALMQKNFARGLAKGALDPTARTWPGAAELTLLRLVGMTWSTSDLSHPVGAAALLLITQYLAQARVRSLGDVAAGLFLCTLASQYETHSKRLVPEAINFLMNAFLILVPTALSPKNVPGSFPIPDVGQEHVKALKLRSTDASLVPGKLAFLASLKGKSDDVQLKVNLVAATLELVKDAAEKYVSLEAFVELIKPAQVILTKAHVDKIPASLKAKTAAVLASLQRMLNLSTSSRKPLVLQHHKPIPIATYIPKFDEGFNPNRKFDPDTERAEANKVRALYKKEKKGAIRELRKDNRFLAGEEAKRKKEADGVYERKIAKVMSGLQDERAEEKRFERQKVAGKKRDKARAAK